MTKFYFPHVQTVLKITSSAVQTRFSRLDQSQSWIFMKCAEIKITAYWGWTPLQKSDRMGINNHFWPKPQNPKTPKPHEAVSRMIQTRYLQFQLKHHKTNNDREQALIIVENDVTWVADLYLRLHSLCPTWGYEAFTLSQKDNYSQLWTWQM